MSYLGLPFFKHKMVSRYERSIKIREQNANLSCHYNNNNKYIEALYYCKLFSSFRVNDLCNSKSYYIDAFHQPENYNNLLV